MSTDYLIFTRGEERMELIEQSSLLTIYIPSTVTGDEYYDAAIPDLTPRQVVTIALEMLKVASYVDGDLVEAMKGQDAYTIAELRRALV